MYGSIGSHGMSTAVDIIAPILGIAAIAAAIVLFIKFASKKADKTKPLTKFFSFDHLFIESITKFLYVFSTTSIAAFCLIYPFSPPHRNRGPGQREPSSKALSLPS